MNFNRIRTVAGLALVSALLVSPFAARAGEATEQLRATIKDFVAIINGTPVSELVARGLPERARILVFARFDFAEMARRSLGSHWGALNGGEQGEFVEGLSQRLLASYGRTVRSNSGDNIQFKNEVREGELVKVATQVVSGSGEELPIDYRLHDVDGQWKVFDVVIDHVSLVNNYRAQFARVIAKSSVRELLRMMKNADS
ncbi:MAG: ABC transporter substrate-binding protein [Deltaproteobacteria bacterium]|nr:ABC transporter substrate-binding protein [Deltaproteobacteria bacterium]MBI3065091.1 ABC transporter substrate-binding protein [Deltaproteobacteria bacterium]